MFGVYLGAGLLAPFNVCLTSQPRAWTKRFAITRNLRAARNRASRLLVVTLAWSGYRQALTTSSSSRVDHLATTFGRHPLAKTMGRLAALLTGLICALHNPYYLTMRRLFNDANVILVV